MTWDNCFFCLLKDTRGGMAMNQKMTEGPVSANLLKFASAILWGLLLQQLYNIVDTIVVGRYLGVDALAAVGATWSLNYIIGYFCIGTGMGISVPLSQAYGAENRHKYRCYFMNGVYFIFCLTVVVTVAVTLLCRVFLEWLQTPANIIEDANTYLFITFAGLPFTILYNYCYGVLMSVGDSKKSSAFMAVSTVINLVLDIVLITTFKMGVAGAAVATVVAQAIAGFCSLIYILKKYKWMYPDKEERKLQMRYVRDIVTMSVPMGLQYSVTAIGAIILQYSVNNLGSDAVAAYSAGSKVKGLFLCPLNALGTALSSFTGQNYGAGKYDRIKEGVKKTIAIGTGYSLLIILLALCFGDEIAMIFVESANTTVIAYIKEFIIYISFFQIELCVLFSARFCVQGMGYGRYSIYSGVAEMLGRSLVAVFVIPVYGFDAVCWSEGITFLAGIAVIVPISLILLNRATDKGV